MNRVERAGVVQRSSAGAAKGCDARGEYCTEGTVLYSRVGDLGTRVGRTEGGGRGLGERRKLWQSCRVERVGRQCDRSELIGANKFKTGATVQYGTFGYPQQLAYCTPYSTGTVRVTCGTVQYPRGTVLHVCHVARWYFQHYCTAGQDSPQRHSNAEECEQ